MNRNERDNWIVYWVSISFILGCLAYSLTGAMGGKAQEDPCQWEIDNAKSVCRALGRKSPECGAAIDKVKLCRDEGSTDPLEGITQRCETQCFTNSLGITTCVTRCYDERGRRV